MGFNELSIDADLREEFLDRFDDLTRMLPPGGAARLEGLEMVELTVDHAAETLREGTYVPASTGLEAIIERFTRPVYLVQDDQIGPPRDDFDKERGSAAREKHGPAGRGLRQFVLRQCSVGVVIARS